MAEAGTDGSHLLGTASAPAHRVVPSHPSAQELNHSLSRGGWLDGADLYDKRSGTAKDDTHWDLHVAAVHGGVR